MIAMDHRKGQILQAIINDYVETASPIGSDWLVSHYDFGCKSATIRNEMAEMLDMGYLLQPHTSAGRIPSNLGYRYYVDCLMKPIVIEDEFLQSFRAFDESSVAAEELIQLTCKFLAYLTQYPSVAIFPSITEASVQRIFLSSASTHHILFVTLFQTGHIEHHLIEVDQPVTDSQLQKIANMVNINVSGRNLKDIAKMDLLALSNDILADGKILSAIQLFIQEMTTRLSNDKVFLEGAMNLLRQREFHDVMKLEQLLNLLDQRSILWRVFLRIPDNQGVTVFIGNETDVTDMSDCSLVVSSYHIREKTAGYLGVLGPTRMHYDRAVAAVGAMSRQLSNILSRTVLD
jgi:heat-inducible transcriptional repressor